ncbi:MAG: N-ethylammeline chlorohydrolase [Gemmatimonadetes bacterium]|nr:MAG: N-ethylammeline chlorohydrolase [Gemmatimonadota bacterium]
MPHCVPGARCDQGAPGGFLGSRHARAAGLDRQRAGDASCRHGAERGAVLAARGGHAGRRRPSRSLRRSQVLHRAGRVRAPVKRHSAGRDQCRHGVRGVAEQQAASHPALGPRFPVRVPVRRSGRPRADPHGRVRRRGADGRAARLLRPLGRLDRGAAPDHHLSAVSAAPDLILAGGDVLLHEGGWRVIRTDVTVKGGRVAAVGQPGTGERPGTGDGERGKRAILVRDCGGCLIIPGLIQAHVHLCQTLFRGMADDLRLEEWLARRIWPLEAAHTEETVYWSAMLGAAELLLGGTTAVLDMETVRHTPSAFKALERIGIRAVAGKCLMDAHPEGAPLELAESTDAALAEAESLARRWHGAAGDRLRVCFAPRFVPSCSGPLLRAASELANLFGAQLHTHAAETIVERETVLRTTGMEEIAYLDSVGISGKRATLAHCVWVDPHEVARLARQGTNVAHCPSSNLKLGSGIAKVPELLEAGCRVALGADGAACNNRLDMFAEMRLAALIQKPRLGADALPAGKVLELATLGGARALGLEDEIGTIAVGRRADLVVMDLHGPHVTPDGADPVSHLVYAACSSDVRDVFVDGRPVVLGHELVTAPAEEIVREAGRSARELRRLARLA